MAAKWLKKLGESLKDAAPTIVGGLGTAAAASTGPFAPLVGGVLANLMRKVTGKSAEDVDFEGMAAQIMGSPELQLEMRKLAIEQEKITLEYEAAKLMADTARIAQVNETMRAEAGSDKWWTSGWRPFCGFIMGTTWGIIGVSFAILIVSVAFGWGKATPAAFAALGDGMADMTVFFSVMLAVLGVTAWGRSQEKRERLKTRQILTGPSALPTD